MAIETLLSTRDKPKVHHAGHDLEGLLNTILTVCHYTIGPCGQLRQPSAGDEEIQFNAWFTTESRFALAHKKSISLEAFDISIKPFLPSYWADFTPFLKRLINATWQDFPYIMAPNIATHKAYRKILMDAHSFYSNQQKDSLYYPYASFDIGKRSHTQANPSTARQRAPKRQRIDDDPDAPKIQVPILHSIRSYVESSVPE